MKVFRATNSLVLRVLYDKILEDEHYDSRESFMQTVKDMLSSDPDGTCILVGADGDTIIAYSITSINSITGTGFIWMAWADPNYPRVAGKMLGALKDWCDSLGVHEIRAETRRDEMRAMARYGFEEFAKIVRIKW